MSRRKQAKPKSTKRLDEQEDEEDDDHHHQKNVMVGFTIKREADTEWNDDDGEMMIDQRKQFRKEFEEEVVEEEQAQNRVLGGGSEGEPLVPTTTTTNGPADEDEEGQEEMERASTTYSEERSASETPPHGASGGLARHHHHHHECAFCQASFGSFFLLKQHEQDTHAHLMPYKCKFCSKGFKHKRSHDRHEKSHSGVRKHKCAYCGQAFFRSDHLKLHLKTHETSKYPFVCILCQRGFHSSSALETHMQMHERRKHSPFELNESPTEELQQEEAPPSSLDTSTSPHTDGTGAKFKSGANSNSQIVSSHNPAASGQFQCSVCLSSFKTPETLLRHMDNDHRILKSSRNSISSSSSDRRISTIDIIDPPTNLNLICHFCPPDDSAAVAFYSEEALELHLKAVHGIDHHHNRKKSIIDNNAAYTCGICGQQFPAIGLLQKHTLYSHTLKDLDNGSENRSTKVSSYRSIADRSSTTTDPTYDCQNCGRSFESILALHGHSISVHGHLPEHVAAPITSSDHHHHQVIDDHDQNQTQQQQQQLYQCNQCDIGTIFDDFQAFSVHMSEHISRKSSSSISISKTMISIDQQEDHRNTNTLNFICEICGQQLPPDENRRRDHLIDHYLRKESRYRCANCRDRSFANPDELQKHLLDMHAINLYRCALCKELFESRVDIQVHFAVAHSDEILRYRCRSCPDQKTDHTEGAGFDTYDQFEAHVRSVHLTAAAAERSIDTAAAADRRSTVSSSAIIDNHHHHRSSIAADASYRCPFCGDAFSVQYLYEKHLENLHRSQMEMFMLQEFIPKTSVSQLLAQATRLFQIDQRSSSTNSNLKPINADHHHRSSTNNNNSTIMGDHHRSTSSSITTTPIKCNICDRRCESMTELAEHKLQHCKVIHSRECHFCREPINSTAEFHSHIRRHNSTNGIPMSCIICKQSLVSSIDTQAHAKFHLSIMTDSSADRRCSCDRCGCSIMMMEEIDIDSHNRLCSNCRYADDFSKKSSIINNNNANISSKCRYCNLKFETPEERNEHESEAHTTTTLNFSNSNSRRSSSTAIVAKPYQCIKCQKSFATELEIQAHVTSHVLQDGIHHYCMLCKKVFDSPSKLQCHLIEHSFVGCSELQCYLCNAIFALPQPLQQHMLTKHGLEERPYECTFSPRCEQRFFFRSELENHCLLHQVQVNKAQQRTSGLDDDTIPVPAAPIIPAPNADTSTTTTEPPDNNNKRSPTTTTTVEENIHHYCPHCGKSFLSLSALQGHSHVHMISKTHQCVKCRKIFPTAAKLRNHQRQHSGDKPFPCTMCMRFFSRKDNLKVHMRIHYKQQSSSSSVDSSSAAGHRNNQRSSSSCSRASSASSTSSTPGVRRMITSSEIAVGGGRGGFTSASSSASTMIIQQQPRFAV